MFKNLFLLICGCCMLFAAEAQDTSGTNGPAVIDTAAILQNLMSLLGNADTPVSYTLVSAGIGNRLFSLHNKQLNAKQASTSTLVYHGSLGYFHRSGFSLAAGANLLNDPKKGFGANQYSITPAFDLNNNKNWTAGISYTRYFVTDKLSDFASPIQNDWYAYGGYTRFWLQPGLSVGYSSGTYTEINHFTVLLTGNTYIDTGTYKLRAFSLTGSLSHNFEWSGVFNNDDGLGFTPSLQMNFSADSTEGLTHTIGQNLVRFLKRRRRLPKLQGKNDFQAQSVALSIDLNYSIGKFTVLPQLYLDYFLPETDDKKFTQTFAVTVGYAF